MERPEDYESVSKLDISNKGLIELPSWVSQCHNLKELYCKNNKITKLDNLPKTLKELICYNNLLKYEFEHTLENIRNYNNKQNKLPK